LRVDLVQAVPLPAPFTIFVEPTNSCNFRCSFCPVSLPDYARDFHDEMSMELFSLILKQIAEFGRIKALKLYFIGEPTMNMQLPAMVRLAKAADVADRVEVTTNGSSLDGALLSCGLDDLRVSIYTPGPTQITRNLMRFIDLREEIGSETPKITVRYMPQSEADEARFRQTYYAICDELQVEGFHSWASTDGLTNISGTSGHKQSCPLIHYMLAIKANGDVVPCCVDWNAKLKLGNVRDMTLRSMWHGEAHESMIMTHLEGKRSTLEACASCDMPDAYPDDIDSLTAEEYARRVSR